MDPGVDGNFMASLGKQPICPQEGEESGKVMAMPWRNRHSQNPHQNSLALSLLQQGTRLLQNTQHSASEMYTRVRMDVGEGCTRIGLKLQDLTSRARNRTRHATQEQPVQLLAIVAGAAFITGIAIRMWRSKAS
jgi:hypothetical protein